MLKSITALLAATFEIAESSAGAPSSTRYVVLQLTVFGGVGAGLLVAHARDPRTLWLGATLIVVSSAFSSGFFRELAPLIPGLAILVPLYPDAFLAFFLALFVSEFPRTRLNTRSDRCLTMLRHVALAAGFTLFGVNALLYWNGLLPQPWRESLAFLVRRSSSGTVYWTVVFGLMALAVPLAIMRVRVSDRQDARRLRLFLAGFLAGLTPMILTNLLELIPRYRQLIGSPEGQRWFEPLLQLSLASIPFTVTYAVLIRRVLPVQWVIRKAVRYVLARSTVAGAFAIPLLVLVIHGYRHRHETLVAILSGQSIWFVIIVVIAGVTLGFRETLLRALDRHFFRESYNAHDILGQLVDQSRRAHRLDELVALMTSGIQRALCPESVSVLVRDQPGKHFVSLFGTTEPLPTSSILAQLLHAVREPIEVRLVQQGTPYRLLPREERQWLVDSHAQLLVPLRSSDGTVVGLITLGERRSELPYMSDDRRLLITIADASALTIEHHAMKASLLTAETHDWWAVRVDGSATAAQECTECGRIQDDAFPACSSCLGTLQTAEVPRILFGKFAFEQRIGHGGMGVVYRARDLTLNRIVAVKTLPGTSPEQAEQLRLEAKAMAAISHRNLAVIFGAESWHGKPLLICEFMAKGTLAHRLTQGPLSLDEALALGVVLADVLELIHAAGLLHRDIKPSNIGYASDGVAKLLDFGLVHMLTQTPGMPTTFGSTNDDASLHPNGLTLTRTTSVIGTPLYLSPEAASGGPPSTSFDLWSLHVLLCEAITGQHPFRGETVRETLTRVRQAEFVPRLLEGCDKMVRVSAYFSRALAKNPSIRPQTAADVSDQLRAILN